MWSERGERERERERERNNGEGGVGNFISHHLPRL